MFSAAFAAGFELVLDLRVPARPAAGRRRTRRMQEYLKQVAELGPELHRC